MKLLFGVLAATGLFAAVPAGFAQDASAADDDFNGRAVVASQSGAPFCTDQVELQDYRNATTAKGQNTLEDLDSCSTFKQPLRVRVIATFPGSDVIKARVYLDRGSVDGFTTTAALAPR